MGTSIRNNRLALAALAVLAPPLMVLASLIRVLRRRWKYTLLGLSIAGNAMFILVLILAYADSDDRSCPDVSPIGVRALLPEGLVSRDQGPLYLAGLRSSYSSSSLFPAKTIFLTFQGCIVASFEFQDGLSTLVNAQLYDAACRPRSSLDVHSGATIYSVYGDSKDPKYSVSDEDADGIPDRKINWKTQESFQRTGAIQWHNVKSGGPRPEGSRDE